MDNTEYKIKKDEIRSLIAQKEYVQAVEIADTIDWRRVRSVMMLCTISDLYKINRRYEDAKNMLLLAYEYRPGGRSICYSLCELCIKMEEFVEAIAYYKEFVQAAPKDPDRYVLQYKLYEAQDVSLEERIEVLKELKQKEYREKWAYELAYLYHRIGQATLCVEECDELILWFGEGKYVYKAMELKMLHQPLSPSQQEKYDHRLDGIRVQDNVPKMSQDVVYPQPSEQSQSYVHPQGYEQSQGYVQPQGYEQGQDYVHPQGYEQSQGYMHSQGYERSQGYVQPQGHEQGQGYVQPQGYEQSQGYVHPQSYEQTPAYEQQSSSRAYEYPRNYEPVREEASSKISPEPEVAERLSRMQPSYQEQDLADMQDLIPAEEEQGNSDKTGETEIRVPIMDMGQCNTINLQAEIAAGLQEVLEKENRTHDDDITRSIIAPMLESDTGRLDGLDVEEADEDDIDVNAGEVEETEVFFSETGEINSVRLGGVKEIVPEMGSGKAPETVPEMSSARASEGGSAQISDRGSVQESDLGGDTKVFEIVRTKKNTKKQAGEVNRAGADSRAQEGSRLKADSGMPARKAAPDVMQKGILPDVRQVSDQTAALVMNQMRMENKAEAQAMIAQPPKELANVLSQESDGQISLVMPERETVEKQITGQMSIEDILAEWERIKRENTERYKAELQQRVLQQTGNMFTEFEAAVRDGLLEKLESEMDRELGEVPVQGEPEDLGEIEELEEIQEPDEAAGLEDVKDFRVPAEPGITKEAEAEPIEKPEEPAKAEIPEEAEPIEKPGTPAGSERMQEARTETIEESEAPAEAEIPAEAEAETIEKSEEPAGPEILQEAEAETIEKPGAPAEPEIPEEAEIIEESEEPAGPEILQEAEAEIIEESEEPAGPEILQEAEAEIIEEAEMPAKPARSHVAAAQQIAVREPEEYISGDAQEAVDYVSEESAGTGAPEGSYQPFEEQERPPVRKLTREERELYAPYIQSRSAREQLVKAIDNISMAAYTGNIVITGDEGMNTITLAKNMIREVQMTDRNFSGKVAKISGQGLNQRNVRETLEQLQNGALIIQKASGIQGNTAAELTRFLRQDNVGIIIVLEDTRKAIARLFAENPKLRVSFTAWMDVEALSNDTLASFGMKYARQMEYSIDDFGMLALHKRIEELQTIDHVVTVVEVKNIVDNAIRHASKKTLGHFMDILLAKRYDEEDMIILTEKDFM